MQVTTLAVDLLQLAANYSYAKNIESLTSSNSSVQLLSYDDRFLKMMGDNMSASVPDSRDWDFVHEAGVYLPDTKTIYAVSQSSSLDNPINVTEIDSKSLQMTASYQLPSLLMPNGGTRYNDSHLLFCTFGGPDTPSALTLFEPTSRSTSVLLSSYYGRRFNSLNDVRIHPDGSIWFTDDMYAAFEGLSAEPWMPAQVYRFDPATGITRAVADGFDQPNGLEFSPDFETLYINDSGYVHQPGNFNGTRPNTIYAYDVVNKTQVGLANRRVLAYGANPFVDGMHVDGRGNIWSSSGKGVTAWDPDGVMLGEIRVDTSVNNFMFMPDGLLLLGFTKLWHIKSGVVPRKEDAF